MSRMDTAMKERLLEFIARLHIHGADFEFTISELRDMIIASKREAEQLKVSCVFYERLAEDIQQEIDSIQKEMLGQPV